MRELKRQLVNAVLIVVTVAAVLAGAINFSQQNRYHLPDDGVTWVDQGKDVVAMYVAPKSPGTNAGLRAGDVLVRIQGYKIGSASEATQALATLGPWSEVEYTIERDVNGKRSEPFSAKVWVAEAEHDSTIFYQYAVAVVYLTIGLFVYFRRSNAQRALHFFLLCLASFVLSAFHYTGKLNNFDKVIYIGNVVAGYLAPSLFLHFCFVFPEPQKWIRRRGAAFLVYLPGIALLAAHFGFAFGFLQTSAPLIEVRMLLDRVWLVFLCAMYLAGGLVVAFQLRRTEDPIVRRQMKWLRNGALIGVLPFALIYAIPYAMGVAPNHAMNLAVLSLPLIPITWAYAILRYRLMDVDTIFQEGYVYTLATIAVLGIFYTLIFSVSRAAGDINGTTMVALILIAAFLFQPIRNWIQEQLDRYYFYRDRYDYRRTLIEFARELGSPTDLDAMLESVADRLIRTLGIRHVAFFVWDEGEEQFRLQLASNRRGKTAELPYGLDLSFLSPAPARPYLFFERTKHLLDVVSQEMPSSVRRSIAELELTYYLPCSARGRTIAYLGVSRTETGDFLSSDDVELLMTLSGYVGIAVDNAMLYQSLARKADEYERLKEFSENIVESINVGILAADLEDRVESWNSQIEKLTGISRAAAVGRTLRELLPGDLLAQLDGFSAEAGVHNIYNFVLRPIRPAGASNASDAARDATLNIAVAPLVSREGNRIGRLIIFDDITDRAELEKRLVQADKLSSIGLLAAGVAHEVNTPLAVISTYAQMLAKQISGDEQKAPLLEKIARQTFRASEIVNSLLNFSRTSPTEFVALELNKVLRETLNLLEHQLKKASVEVKLSLDESLPKIKGNPGKLQQVFLNLFLNARDAMESGGVLALSSSSSDGLVKIVVADSGAGIARENLLKIFDPFFTTKIARKGTGLGLSVSYGIVREHGGDIRVESEVGAGTRFELTFPLAARESSPVRRAEPVAARTETIVTSAPSISISTESAPSTMIARTDRMIQ